MMSKKNYTILKITGALFLGLLLGFALYQFTHSSPARSPRTRSESPADQAPQEKTPQSTKDKVSHDKNVLENPTSSSPQKDRVVKFIKENPIAVGIIIIVIISIAAFVHFLFTLIKAARTATHQLNDDDSNNSLRNAAANQHNKLSDSGKKAVNGDMQQPIHTQKLGKNSTSLQKTTTHVKQLKTDEHSINQTTIPICQNNVTNGNDTTIPSSQVHEEYESKETEQDKTPPVQSPTPFGQNGGSSSDSTSEEENKENISDDAKHNAFLTKTNDIRKEPKKLMQNNEASGDNYTLAPAQKRINTIDPKAPTNKQLAPITNNKSNPQDSESRGDSKPSEDVVSDKVVVKNNNSGDEQDQSTGHYGDNITQQHQELPIKQKAIANNNPPENINKTKPQDILDKDTLQKLGACQAIKHKTEQNKHKEQSPSPPQQPVQQIHEKGKPPSNNNKPNNQPNEDVVLNKEDKNNLLNAAYFILAGNNNGLSSSELLIQLQKKDDFGDEDYAINVDTLEQYLKEDTTSFTQLNGLWTVKDSKEESTQNDKNKDNKQDQSKISSANGGINNKAFKLKQNETNNDNDKGSIKDDQQSSDKHNMSQNKNPNTTNDQLSETVFLDKEKDKQKKSGSGNDSSANQENLLAHQKKHQEKLDKTGIEHDEHNTEKSNDNTEMSKEKKLPRTDEEKDEEQTIKLKDVSKLIDVFTRMIQGKSLLQYSDKVTASDTNNFNNLLSPLCNTPTDIKAPWDNFRNSQTELKFDMYHMHHDYALFIPLLFSEKSKNLLQLDKLIEIFPKANKITSTQTDYVGKNASVYKPNDSGYSFLVLDENFKKELKILLKKNNNLEKIIIRTEKSKINWGNKNKNKPLQNSFKKKGWKININSSARDKKGSIVLTKKQ